MNFLERARIFKLTLPRQEQAGVTVFRGGHFVWWDVQKRVDYSPSEKNQTTFTWLGHSGYIHALFFSHEAEHWEDGKTCQEAGAAVQEAQHERVPENTQTRINRTTAIRTLCKTRNRRGLKSQALCVYVWGSLRLWETWHWGLFFKVWLYQCVFSVHSSHSFWKLSDQWELTSYISVNTVCLKWRGMSCCVVEIAFVCVCDIVSHL